MVTWAMRPEERRGSFLFSGSLVVTKGVQENLSPYEITLLSTAIQYAIHLYGGLNYIVVFECSDGRIVYVIDNLNKELYDTADYAKENYCTMLLPYEY